MIKYLNRAVIGINTNVVSEVFLYTAGSAFFKECTIYSLMKPYCHHHCVVKGSGVGLEGLHNPEHEAEVRADQEKFERRAGVLTYVGQSCLDDDTSKH